MSDLLARSAAMREAWSIKATPGKWYILYQEEEHYDIQVGKDTYDMIPIAADVAKHNADAIILTRIELPQLLEDMEAELARLGRVVDQATTHLALDNRPSVSDSSKQLPVVRATSDSWLQSNTPDLADEIRSRRPESQKEGRKG